MTLGDQGTYSTMQRVIPLTDGTSDSIRMANPGTTYEAGVMPGAWRLSTDLQGHAAVVDQVLEIHTWGSVV